MMLRVQLVRSASQSLSPLRPLRDEGCCGAARTPGGSQVPAGRWGAGPGAPGRHGPWFRLGGGNHSPAGRRHRLSRIQLGRHGGERQGAGEAAAAAAELQSVRQSAETEAAPDALHAGAAERAGAQLRQNPLPWHLHEGGTGAEDRPHRVQSSGTGTSARWCCFFTAVALGPCLNIFQHEQIIHITLKGMGRNRNLRVKRIKYSAFIKYNLVTSNHFSFTTMCSRLFFTGLSRNVFIDKLFWVHIRAKAHTSDLVTISCIKLIIQVLYLVSNGIIHKYFL